MVLFFKKRKRIISRILAVTLSIIMLMWMALSLPKDAYAEMIPGPDVRAESYCVIDGNTGEIIMAKNPYARKYPASTTKVMTALLVIESVSDLDQKLTFTQSAVNVDPSSSTLSPKAQVGEIMSVRDALYGMMLPSANECGAMLGEFVGGSEAVFVDMMNARAKMIGALNTHFTNAYGIHNDDHYTTAYDLCLILREAMANPTYRELFETVYYRIPATNKSESREFVVSHQFLRPLEYRDEAYKDVTGVIGGKTGSTPQAGKVLVTACERDGYYTISSLMASDASCQYADELVLLEYTYGYLNRTKPPVIWTDTHDIVEATASVRLRYSPSLNGGIYGALEEGQQIIRDGIYGAWAKIKTETGTYYCVNEFLRTLEPEKVPEPTEYEWPTETEAPTVESASEGQPEEPTAGEEPTSSQAASEASSAETTTPPTSAPGSDEQADNNDELLYLLVPVGIILVLLIVWLIVYLKAQEKKEKEYWKRR